MLRSSTIDEVGLDGSPVTADAHDPFEDNANSSVSTRLARRILTLIFEKRRLLPEESSTESFEEEAAPHISKLLYAIKRLQPIHLILPGFPAKSPNRNKTLGPLPDLADKVALHNLFVLGQRIQSVYEPGAIISICSDGRVFSDLVKIPDDDVSAYNNELKVYAKAEYGDAFDFVRLDDIYPNIKDFDILREELLVDYGESIVSLRHRCKQEKEARAMYLGITRFIFEDYQGLTCFKNHSRTGIQKIARQIAYRVIQRSNAWTRLLEDYFGNAIRLSVHPQFRVSSKIGVYLMDSEDIWMTPWHAVAVKSRDKVVLRRKVDAEKIGLLAFSDGRPSHFELVEDVPNDWRQLLARDISYGN